VKINPSYKKDQAVYVTDASRAVGVVSKLLGEQGQSYKEEIEESYKTIAEKHMAAQQNKKRLSLEKARENAHKAEWDETKPTKPAFIGTKTFTDFDLTEIAEFIDWTPFFATWEMNGQYPRILNDDKFGEAATNLFNDAQEMLKKMIDEKWVKANGVIGFWPANSEGDDIVLYEDDTREEKKTTLHTLRQQIARENTSGKLRANAALSDFIAPIDTGIEDYIGGFAVTAGIGEDIKVKEFNDAGDDYSKIMVSALADRLAEAFAEYMHLRVRKEYWGYATDEGLSNEEVIAEKYQGIRPAPGYPAQPDHTEKETLFELLDAETQAGIELTESYAMWPGAAVSGLYFSHPSSYYFGVGKVEKDQVEDYAKRKGWSLETAEKWLSPILNYIPE
jgi:5-methyltetrahydrofolate--homocysteine methyltransferase